jgi:hypothetical protein
MHSLLVTNFWSSKIWIGQLIKLLMNWWIHIKFHFKFFIMIEYALKNEIIESGVIF